MRLSPGELVSRATDRTSLRLKFLTVLAIAGVLLVLAAYLVLGMRYDAQTNQRIDGRADELATLLGTSIGEDEQLQALLDDLAQFDDVRSIAVTNIDRRTIVAEAGAITDKSAADAPLRAIEVLETAIRSGTGATSQTPPVELRPIVSNDPADMANGGYLVAIELDRSVIGADLESGMHQGLALFIVGIVLLVVLVYLLVTFGVTRPLKRLSALDAAVVGTGKDARVNQRPMDEIALLDHRLHELLGSPIPEPQQVPVPRYVVSDTLPDLWVRFGADLNVLESRLDDAGGERAQPMELGIGHLSDLLSPDIVRHLVEIVKVLKPGDDDWFEFAVGVRLYRASINAGDGDFVLELSEGAPEAFQAEDPNIAAAAVLGELLEDLPVGVLEADSGGIVRYANRGLFGMPDAQSLLGRSIDEFLPASTAESGRQAMRAARGSGEPKLFTVPADPVRDLPGTTNHVVATETDEGASYFLLSIETPFQKTSERSDADLSALEEQVWALELKVSSYEEQISTLSGKLEQARLSSEGDVLAAEALVDDISSPMAGVLKAAHSFGGNGNRKQDSESIAALGTAVMALARVLDDRLGTTFLALTEAAEATQSSRFHLATLLDEIAIEASARGRASGSRISAFVQPSLPKWLFGSEYECRTAIHQMIEFARLVSAGRPLTLAAMQDASTGKLIQVRFEIQIPPPKLEQDDIEVLRGCISGEMPDGNWSSSHRAILESDNEDFAPLDIELVTINDEATVLRCSTSFELTEEVEAEHSWVRGLRTLIIQDPASNDNGIQSALSAFGIMGYVVTSENDLVEALRIAEEYSNPYRLVVADVDTTDLESFVGQLFDGDAPVVLVGKDSESAMVGAISAGYSGYIAKPVRQVDLLEVILSTVEPPAHLAGEGSTVTAA